MNKKTGAKTAKSLKGPFPTRTLKRLLFRLKKFILKWINFLFLIHRFLVGILRLILFWMDSDFI